MQLLYKLIEYGDVILFVWTLCGIIAAVVALIDDVAHYIRHPKWISDYTYQEIFFTILGRILTLLLLFILGPISIALGVVYFVGIYREAKERKRRW